LKEEKSSIDGLEGNVNHEAEKGSYQRIKKLTPKITQERKNRYVK